MCIKSTFPLQLTFFQAGAEEALPKLQGWTRGRSLNRILRCEQKMQGNTDDSLNRM